MSRIIPDSEQQTWLNTANKAYLLNQDEGFSDQEHLRTALMAAWEAIEMLVDADTFYALVGEQ